MTKEIKITRKNTLKGSDGHKYITVRIPETLLSDLDALSAETNRSRNELINRLLEAALELVHIEDDCTPAT